MKLLSLKQSSEYLYSIAGLFGCEQNQQISAYLNSKSWHSWIFANNPHRLPLFFWDEKDAKKHFESAIGLSGNVKDEEDNKVYFISKYDLIPEVVKFLESQKVRTVLATGNWNPADDPGHVVVELETKEIVSFFRRQCFDDIYFFPEDFSWMLAFNHHGLGFFAGSDRFIEDFTYFYPDYRKFVNYHDICPDC